MDKHVVDLIIIGSGQGGVPLASAFAEQGQQVFLFERGQLGGSCVNYGCTPSKAFLASAHMAAQARTVSELGLEIELKVNASAVMERVRGLINSFNQGVETGLDEAGVNVIHSEAEFVDTRTVSGGDVTVQAPRVVINTGRSPRIPDIPGLAGSPYLTYKNFWDLSQVPPRMLILGGGYVGLELGQGLARLGCEVDLIEQSDRILNNEEADVSETLTSALEQDGVHLHLEQETRSVAYADDRFTLTLSNGQTLEAETLLVAAGREPNTQALNAEASGIDLDERGFVTVDQQFQTTCPGVYAIGDVIDQPAFTHISWEDHRRLKAIWDGQDRRRGDRVPGYAAFTEPQVGRAGLTLEQAKDQGYQARSVTTPLKHVARAIETGYELGFYRMVIDEETDRILGATLVGPQTAELVHIFIAHMEAGTTWHTLEQSVHIHPAFAEALPGLARKLKDD